MKKILFVLCVSVISQSMCGMNVSEVGQLPTGSSNSEFLEENKELSQLLTSVSSEYANKFDDKQQELWNRYDEKLKQYSWTAPTANLGISIECAFISMVIGVRELIYTDVLGEKKEYKTIDDFINGTIKKSFYHFRKTLGVSKKQNLDSTDEEQLGDLNSFFADIIGGEDGTVDGLFNRVETITNNLLGDPEKEDDRGQIVKTVKTILQDTLGELPDDDVDGFLYIFTTKLLKEVLYGNPQSEESLESFAKKILKDLLGKIPEDCDEGMVYIATTRALKEALYGDPNSRETIVGIIYDGAKHAPTSIIKIVLAWYLIHYGFKIGYEKYQDIYLEDIKHYFDRVEVDQEVNTQKIDGQLQPS